MGPSLLENGTGRCRVGLDPDDRELRIDTDRGF